MRFSTALITTALILITGSAIAQSVRVGPDGFSFRFDRDDRRGDVEGKRATCEIYARIAVVQADANERFRCGFQGPAWANDPARHFQWCRYVPRHRVAEEQLNRSAELQRCFDRLGDFDDDRSGDYNPRDHDHDDDHNSRDRDHDVTCPRGYDGSSGVCLPNHN
jgi:hypothetical protein